jgi:hypothetical protein
VEWSAALVDAGDRDGAHATGLAKALATQVAQEVTRTLDRTLACDGVKSPPALERAIQALGLFRLLKGPGELLALQAIAALTGWMGEMGPAPSAWPSVVSNCRDAFLVTVADLQQLPAGRSQPVLAALAQAAGCLLTLVALALATDPGLSVRAASVLYESRLQRALGRAQRLARSGFTERLESFFSRITHARPNSA